MRHLSYFHREGTLAHGIVNSGVGRRDGTAEKQRRYAVTAPNGMVEEEEGGCQWIEAGYIAIERSTLHVRSASGY